MGANAVTTVPVYTAGEVLTAADMNITNSGIPVFATTVTRDAAFGGAGEKTLAEGQFAYIEASDQTQFYNGTSWVALGVIQQVQYVALDAQLQFTSATFTDLTGYSITITPKSTSSLIRIDISLNTRPQNAGALCAFQVLRTSTPTLITSFNAQGTNDYFTQVAASWVDNPATTSATTYKIQGKANSGIQTINSGGSKANGDSTFILTEFLP